MKVLLVSLFHPELVRGGAQQVCYELFEGLKDQSDMAPTLLASVDESCAFLFKSGARITDLTSVTKNISILAVITIMSGTRQVNRFSSRPT